MENKYVSKSYPILNLINDIKKIRFQDLDLLKKKCDLLEALSERNNDAYGEAFSHIYLAHWYQINQRDGDYKFHSEKARKISESNHFSDILIEYYKLSGIYHSESGDELSSFSSLLLGLEITMKEQDYEAGIAFNNNIAEAFYQSKMLDQAETYFLKALESASQVEGRPKYKDLVLMNLVDVFIQKKDIKQAKYWFEKNCEYGQDTSLTAAYLKRSEICILVLENKIQEAFDKIKILRKDLENEEPMLFIHVYLYIMDVLLEIKNIDYATWCLNILMSLTNEVNAQFKLQILTFRVKYSEIFDIEDIDAYAEFYETSLYYKETQRKMNYNSLNDLIELHYAKSNQEHMMKKEESLQILIDNDDLTGVYNRRYFSKLLTKYMYDDNVDMLGIVMIDIDYFKEYNDFYGHIQGDKVLKNVARVLSDHLPEGIFASRFGGDEFSCICINKKDGEIISFIEKLQAKVRQMRIEHQTHRSDKYITLSFGFYNGKERDNLLEKADDALYKAKSLGRNTYFPRLYKKGRESDKVYSEIMKKHDQVWFNDRYNEALGQNQKYALVQVNIKNFHYYNTKYGYKEGDEILFLVHEALMNLLQDDESITRIYADNFALIVTYDDIDNLVNIRLQKSIDIVFQIEDPRIYRNIFLTYGIYEMNDKDMPFQQAWNNAGLVRKEIAAPTQRSSCLGVYGQAYHNAYLNKIQLEVDTANAYRNYEFVPFYQPKVDAKTHEIVGAEVLLRWYDDTGNLVPLYKFLPILNENSYINLIDLDIFDMTCKMLDERIKKGQPVVPISFNISKSYFYDPNIISDYINVFEKYDIPKHLIEIELMETISLNDVERLKCVIQGFKEYGFKCMLDDFGNGYSSFNALLNNELYAVKLDRQFFVKNLNGDNKFIIKTVIDLIKSLHMKVVAEGVETKEYADFLAECGCDIIQGFYFYKPMPLKKFSTLLNQAR